MVRYHFGSSVRPRLRSGLDAIADIALTSTILEKIETEERIHLHTAELSDQNIRHSKSSVDGFRKLGAAPGKFSLIAVRTFSDIGNESNDKHHESS